MTQRFSTLQALFERIQSNGSIGIDQMALFVTAQHPGIDPEQAYTEAKYWMMTVVNGAASEELVVHWDEFQDHHRSMPGFWEPHGQVIIIYDIMSGSYKASVKSTWNPGSYTAASNPAGYLSPN